VLNRDYVCDILERVSAALRGLDNIEWGAQDRACTMKKRGLFVLHA
jgi:hypothetical protein